eukprot:CAMPEP_0182518708 /NCGR_PEP_ID=MMETSP1321-20130603/44711_1 /TAXON_ID=91990 /ORGANISM="Bolidomonas sp., Strain RCC1657" /LENGTH=586 /DNA_ID=CAMNT_0024726647 /DNA_START=232 /DNA_END=1992 /DNA_ORIENTATION=-
MPIEVKPICQDWYEEIARGDNYFTSAWFAFIGVYAIEVKPICQDWYEEIARGDNYFTSAWFAFIGVYAVSFLLRYAYKLRRWEITTLVNCQKLAAILILQAPIIILPMTLYPERLLENIDWNRLEMRESLVSLVKAVLPSLISFFVISAILYLTIRRSSQNFKRIRAKLLEADTITTEETIEDIELQGPYYAAFCLQYTPQMYNHEEKAFVRKFLWIFGMKVIQFMAVVIANYGIVLVATNLWYIRHLLRRPYASHRPSSTMGDPLNDAELLTTRTVSMAAAILSLRDTLATSTITGGSFASWFTTKIWLMDILCAFLLVFVVCSNIRLFSGLDNDFTRAASRILNSVRSSSMRDSESSIVTLDEDETRSRSHTGANEVYHDPINKMLDEESYREIISIQRDLRIDLMPATEQNRWVDSEERSTACRRMIEGLGLFILVVLIIVGMVIAADYRNFPTSLRKTIAWMMTLLPTFLYFVMEFFVWRSKQSWTNATVSSTSNEREAKPPTDEENPPAEMVASPVHNAPNNDDDKKDDDDNDDAANIELPQINPPETPKQRKPSMIKTPSSRPPIPVRTLAVKFDKSAVI